MTAKRDEIALALHRARQEWLALDPAENVDQGWAEHHADAIMPLLAPTEPSAVSEAAAITGCYEDHNYAGDGSPPWVFCPEHHGDWPCIAGKVAAAIAQARIEGARESLDAAESLVECGYADLQQILDAFAEVRRRYS